MRRLLALIGKEWRDARVVTFGAAAAAVGLTFAVHEMYFDYGEPGLVARSLVPGLLALYLVAVASDLVAAEMATRRVETNALLPARPIVAWAAKAAFLILAAMGFLVFLVAAQVAVYRALGAPGIDGEFFGALLASPLSLAPALAAGFVTLFFSTLIPRGFAAAICGLAVVVGVGWGFHAINWFDLDLDWGEDERNLLGLGLAVVFGLGSLAAFAGGRLHLDRRLRRIALGATVVIVLSLVPGSLATRSLAERLSLEPGNDAVRITGMSVSPDGHHLALGVQKSGTTLHRVWVLDIENGNVLAIPGHRSRLPGRGSGECSDWDDTGLLRIVDTARVRTHNGTSEQRTGNRWIDPATGAIRRTGPEGTPPVERSLRQWWRRRHLAGKGIVIDWPDREISKTFPADTAVFSTWRPGFVVVHPRKAGKYEDPILLDLESGRERAWPCESPLLVSPDGRYLATSRRIVNLDTDRTVAGPWQSSRIVGWRSPGRFSIRLPPDHVHIARTVEQHGLQHSIVDLRTGCETALPGSPWQTVMLPDGRFALIGNDRRTLTLLDREGQPLRRLYGPRSEESARSIQ